ncbi:MAG: hypothetical protein HUU29_06960 [Planctomycetaceae bacterium]|nr:hypothetical protein [Planctomycetaceae bacterium]
MQRWIQQLERHRARISAKYPDEPLMMLMDIDGTFFDVRHAIRHLLELYDRTHGAAHFAPVMDLVENVNPTMPMETALAALLLYTNIPESERLIALSWFRKRCSTYEVLLKLHQPCEGVFEIVQAIASQPRTEVGFNSSRPEFLRGETLRALNSLAIDYGLQFRGDQLYMDSGSWVGNAPFVKVSGLKHFQNKGYRIFAALDSEPANLDAIWAADTHREIMTLSTEGVLSAYHDTVKLRAAHIDALARRQSLVTQ